MVDVIHEQKNNFVFDSGMRRLLLLPEGVEGAIVLALEKELPSPVLTLVAAFCDPNYIEDFVDVANEVRVRAQKQKLDSKFSVLAPRGAHVQRRPPYLVKNMNVYRNLFYAFAGPVAKANLPHGVYFTGSLCVAAAVLPPPEAAALEKVADALDAGASYDEFVGALNTRMNFPNTRVGDLGDPTVKAVTLNYLEEQDGLGPYARADVDIVVVAKSDRSAREKVKQTLTAVVDCVGADCLLVETPNSITVIPPFPQKHVQIITLWNRSEAEYLSFVDLDCTSLLFDGRNRLLGARRALLAFTTGLNCIPTEMLSVRMDTPNRIGKYCIRGFGSFVFGCLSLPDREKWERAERAARDRQPGYFIDMARDDFESDYADRLLAHKTHTQTLAYSDTRLPRGYEITPRVVELFLERFWKAAKLSGRVLITRKFEEGDVIRVTRKTKAKKENWWSWGMV
jgi:hypothetical protein